MQKQTPSFSTLRYVDYTFKSAVSMIVGSLIFQVVTYMGFGQFYLPIVALTASLTVIGIIMFIYRYNLIMSTFRDGVTIIGKILDLETISTRTDEGSRRRQYYGKFAYTVQGQSHEIRLRIADNPHLMGLEKGGDIELVLREEKPKTVFIKMLYLP